MSSGMKNAKAHAVEEREDIYSKLKSHFTLIGSAPCYNFAGYPFHFRNDIQESSYKVSITAVIEHFGEEQQQALVKRFQQFLKRPTSPGIFQPELCMMLKASTLQRMEGGIQFEAKDAVKPERLMEEIKVISEHRDLWKEVVTYEDFQNLCQIRYRTNKPFGDTTARFVRFGAKEGTPIFLMIYLLMQLDSQKGREACGFGQVSQLLLNIVKKLDHRLTFYCFLGHHH